MLALAPRGVRLLLFVDTVSGSERVATVLKAARKKDIHMP